MPPAHLPNFDALWNYDDPADTERRFVELLPAARTAGDTSYLAELLTQVARAQGLMGRFEEAHRTLDEAEALLDDGMAVPRARLLLERGRALNSSGEPDRARPLFLEAWYLASREGADFYSVDAAHMMAIVEPPDRAIEWNVRALELAEQSEQPRARGWLGSLYNNLGWAYHDLGRYEEALETFQKGLEWQRSQGKEREARIAAWTVARALRSLGRYQEALAMQRQNLERMKMAGGEDGFIHEELGECLLAVGARDEAQKHFAQAHAALSRDAWLAGHEPERLERLKVLGGVP